MYFSRISLLPLAARACTFSTSKDRPNLPIPISPILLSAFFFSAFSLPPCLPSLPSLSSISLSIFILNYSPSPPSIYLIATMSSSSPSSSPSSGMGFPVVAIAIMGILGTAAFLLGYYVFVIKCCLNLNRSDSNENILRRFSRSRRIIHRHFSPATASAERRGLDPSSIRAIPIFRYSATTAFIANECAVCLLEFRDEERLRLLPGCSHAFHIDCIDTWLASNANCPLCRAEVTHTLPTTADSMVIEVGEVAPAAAEKKSGKWRGLAGSLGDECVEVRREKEEAFAVQPMRRSLSMDSSGDRPLYIAVQEAVRRNPDLLFREVESGRGGGGGVGGGSGRRAFFSFGRSRSSMRAVLPVELDV